jgi:hypothetical protein
MSSSIIDLGYCHQSPIEILRIPMELGRNKSAITERIILFKINFELRCIQLLFEIA